MVRASVTSTDARAYAILHDRCGDPLPEAEVQNPMKPLDRPRTSHGAYHLAPRVSYRYAIAYNPQVALADQPSHSLVEAAWHRLLPAAIGQDFAGERLAPEVLQDLRARGGPASMVPGDCWSLTAVVCSWFALGNRRASMGGSRP